MAYTGVELMIIDDIAKELEKIQLREHVSVPQIVTNIPDKYLESSIDTLRYLVLWNKLNKAPGYIDI